MRTESLHETIHAEPFRPFSICLANGAKVDVRHPETILHPTGSRTAVVMGPDESVRILDVALIVELQIGPPIPAGAIAADPNGG